jgi:Carbon monoxide dehydrogenase subunit G (CoxG)
VRAREVRGNGTAEARAVLQLTSSGESTRVEVAVDVDLTGRAASMGQGAIEDVTSKMVGRFARNLTRMLSATDDESAPPIQMQDDTLSAADIVGTVVLGRLRQPAVLGGLATVIGLLTVLILRRNKRTATFAGTGGAYPGAVGSAVEGGSPHSGPFYPSPFGNGFYQAGGWFPGARPGGPYIASSPGPAYGAPNPANSGDVGAPSGGGAGS